MYLNLYTGLKMSFLNTDIDFSMIPQLQAYPNWFTAASIASETLPTEFSWGIITTNDTKEMINKKKIITKPQHQYNCGSCFAMAVATCINDVFIVSGQSPQNLPGEEQNSVDGRVLPEGTGGAVTWNPMISTTYLMQTYNYKQFNVNILDKCRGGNPAILLSEIEKSKGVVSERCVDYSWCSSNRKCKYRNKNILGSLTDDELMNYLNTTITPKGCFFSTTSDGEPITRLVYKIKNMRKISNSNLDTTTTILKDLVYKNGPIIMGFVVLENWSNGNFNKNSGIYFHNGNYDLKSPEKFLPANTTSKEDGKHAVVIIGWGRSYIDIDNNGNKDFVDYWHCRNTFGPNWGDGGYFKYAMYPYNKVLQSLGGYLTFQAGNIYTEKISQTTSAPPSVFEQNENYYRTSETMANIHDITPPYRNIDDFKMSVVGFFFLLLLFLNLIAKY